MYSMFTPALPSFAATLPSAPGVSESVTARTSSSVARQPCEAKTLRAVAGLSTTMRTAPRPPSVAPMRATMFVFFSPSAVAISPSIPGWSATHSVSCFALGIPLLLL